MLTKSPALRRLVGVDRPTAAAAPPSPSGMLREPAPAGGGLLTPEQVALRLGVSAAVLERWRGTRAGPAFVRLSSKTIRYRAEDVEGFVSCRIVA